MTGTRTSKSSSAKKRLTSRLFGHFSAKKCQKRAMKVQSIQKDRRGRMQTRHTAARAGQPGTPQLVRADRFSSVRVDQPLLLGSRRPRRTSARAGWARFRFVRAGSGARGASVEKTGALSVSANRDRPLRGASVVFGRSAGKRYQNYHGGHKNEPHPIGNGERSA